MHLWWRPQIGVRRLSRRNHYIAARAIAKSCRDSAARTCEYWSLIYNITVGPEQEVHPKR